MVYHDTEVVLFDADTIILDHGGWRTSTTKTRMNQTATQYGLGFRVFQKDFDWFVSYRGLTVKFGAGLGNPATHHLDRREPRESDRPEQGAAQPVTG